MTSRKIKTRLIFKLRSVSCLSSSNNMPPIQLFSLIFLKSSFRSFLIPRSFLNISFAWFKIPRFLCKHKSRFLWLCICRTVKKSQKSEKNNWRKNWKNLEKQERAMIFQKKYWRKSFFKLTKILLSKKNLETSSTIFWTIART